MRSLVLHPAIARRDTRRQPENALAEAVSLARALDLDVAGSEVVRLPKAHAGMLFGTGKVEELAKRIEADEIGLVLIDAAVTPIQQRNLERRWKAKVLDRTGLILEIFGARAATREGVLQVDLAALAYQRSRLVRSWTHLERQRGGLSFIGGAGETQIEADRRARKKIPYPIVALVGYTNAGKSTLFNRLTGAGVLVRDMLFATLDPTMRAVSLPSGREIILSDTVGFISELPTQLVAAFRATLEEVLDADLILHVRDITHPESREQADDVNEILTSLGIGKQARETQIEVWNKIDTATPEQHDALVTAAARNNRIFAVSATSGEGIGELLDGIAAALSDAVSRTTLSLGFAEGRKRAWLFQQNLVDHERQTDSGYELDVAWTERQSRRYEKL